MKKFFSKEVLLRILKYYLITRIVLAVLMIVFKFLLPIIPNEYSNIFMLYDNQYYIGIAKDGYTDDLNYAFFPLVPLLIRYLGQVGFFILNQILTIASGYLLYIIDKDIFKNKDNYRLVILWLVSPISIFTMMFYTEGLFIFLTLLGYLLYKKKKNYCTLGIIIGLSVMTRSLGSMLFFTIFISMLVNVFKKKEKFYNILITFIPATIISCLYPIYSYYQKGNFFYFIEVQKFWYKVGSNIFTVFIDSFKLLNFNYYICIFNYFLTLILFIYIIYTIIKNRKEKKYYEIYLYMILSLISICSKIKGNYDPLTSYYRYIFGCFTIYFLLSRKDRIIIIISSLTIFISILFLVGYYFY